MAVLGEIVFGQRPGYRETPFLVEDGAVDVLRVCRSSAGSRLCRLLRLARRQLAGFDAEEQDQGRNEQPHSRSRIHSAQGERRLAAIHNMGGQGGGGTCFFAAFVKRIEEDQRAATGGNSTGRALTSASRQFPSGLSSSHVSADKPSTAAAICATNSSARDAGAPVNLAR